jgi:hypothetical protein
LKEHPETAMPVREAGARPDWIYRSEEIPDIQRGRNLTSVNTVLDIPKVGISTPTP